VAVLLGVLGIIILTGDFFARFFEGLIDRAGGNNMTVDTLTSNRFSIQADYLNILLTDLQTFFFGRGFSYYQHLITITSQQAHNTYFDLVLSWGIAGTLLFLLIMTQWQIQYKNRWGAQRFTRRSKIPLLVLLLCFMSLSLFDAGMFFFVIAFCMIQLEPVQIGALVNVER
jgi:hypothetical protein